MIDEMCENVIVNPSFLDAEPDVSDDILIRDMISVSEVNFFKAFVAWKSKYLERTEQDESKEEKVQKIQSLLKKIHFFVDDTWRIYPSCGTEKHS